jgi:hypothetical protein
LSYSLNLRKCQVPWQDLDTQQVEAALKLTGMVSTVVLHAKTVAYRGNDLLADVVESVQPQRRVV